MTRKEVENMPAGREMDVLVAVEIMGWKLQTDKQSGLWFSVPENQNPSGFGSEDMPPLYSTDITAAWEVVEKLKENEVYITLCTLENDYQCELDSIKANELSYDSVIGKTAPLAICRAALLAVMEEK